MSYRFIDSDYIKDYYQRMSGKSIYIYAFEYVSILFFLVWFVGTRVCERKRVIISIFKVYIMFTAYICDTVIVSSFSVFLVWHYYILVHTKFVLILHSLFIPEVSHTSSIIVIITTIVITHHTGLLTDDEPQVS